MLSAEKIFRIIYNLYQDIKSCVVFSGKQPAFFQIYTGLSQGENLSPVLFRLFLNDLEEHLDSHYCSNVNFNVTDSDINVHLKLGLALCRRN